MKKAWIYGTASLVLLTALTTACNSKGEEQELASQISTTTAVQTQAQLGTQIQEAAGAGSLQAGAMPSIDGNLKLDGRTALITYSVSNLQLSNEHVGKQNVQGEGHLHLYVDGKQKGMFSQVTPLKLTNLATGKHEIKLELQQNDHSDMNIQKIFNIEVK
ncbi:hypothetical protein [Paenibacillus hexagrammi]|uniref:Lipoprotein n=1 Tax=Paenibacillus hexagrammi TaxID=2908839 RepID=A0ABY3SGN8_9BACL|nr:hypothetical protein [Paenibacillus sp. YPD9-1]UJF33149.1 hypothetical protein L0M14_27015 [Paenibacillus sp. YPD9-1]